MSNRDFNSISRCKGRSTCLKYFNICSNTHSVYVSVCEENTTNHL